MKLGGAPSRFILLAVLLWLAAAFLARALVQHPLFAGARDQSLLDRLFGESRKALSDDFVGEADVYFHGGVREIESKAFTGFFEKLKEQLQPRAHLHAKGHDVYEFMPWLRFATRTDPHNVAAYTVAAYWVAREGREYDKALAILVEGEKMNPGDYRIQLARAQLYFKLGRESEARDELDLGIKKWPATQGVETFQKNIDLSSLLTLRASLAELAGDWDTALRLYEASFRLQPENRLGLDHKLARFRAGDYPTTAELQQFRKRLLQTEEAEIPCHREHAHGEQCHDHDHEHPPHSF